MVTPSLPTMPPVRHSIDIKANGEVSRMRNHKGNMPSLPQTKYCSLCPAKFTRTTHLNRHLRSHTNERLHRCTTCNAEFTRSDLLTRHKRTCGDSRNANKSRRKSCQACAESKVKCNLQLPCSKCSARGRECIFINDPEASRNKRNAAKKGAQQSSPSKGSIKSTLVAASPSASTSYSTSSPTYPSLFATADVTPSPTLSLDSQLLPLTPLDLPPLSVSSSSSVTSTRSSPQSDPFEPRGDFARSFEAATFDTLTLDTQLSRLFPNPSFDTFALDPTISPCSPSSAPLQELSTWYNNGEAFQRFGRSDIFPSPHNVRMGGQDFMSDFTPLAPALQLNVASQAGPTTTNHTATPLDSPNLLNTLEPTVEDLEHYLYLFFSAFSAQVPIIHPSTWRPEGKPPILIRAMQACGALFVQTRVAMNFINATLSTMRDTLVSEFSNSSADSNQQIHIIIAVALLQAIGLFHQKADQRVSSNVYHGMLVMMIRRTSLINRVASWSPPDLNDTTGLDKAWKEWAQYETVKRVLLISYLQDCCHCMYFSMSPSFHPGEFNINLPCDEGLWTASTPGQWLQAAKTPSQYGIGLARLSGFSMQRALATLTELHPTAAPPTLNPFAHFILIHTILRNLYASNIRSQSDLASVAPDSADSVKETAFSAQYALHIWLQMWVSSPEALLYENGREEPPFIYNAFPFYWLAQVSLIAMQDDIGVDINPLDDKNEGRYRLMRKWLDRIKSHLRSGSQVPPQLWEELAKIRLQIQQRLDQSGELPGGLTSFFRSD